MTRFLVESEGPEEALHLLGIVLVMLCSEICQAVDLEA